jgi:hypothetical protein
MLLAHFVCDACSRQQDELGVERSKAAGLEEPAALPVEPACRMMRKLPPDRLGEVSGRAAGEYAATTALPLSPAHGDVSGLSEMKPRACRADKPDE